TFLPSPARLATEDQPEPESASTPSITPSSLILPLTSSLASPSIDDVPVFAPTPHVMSSVSLTNFEYLPSAMVDQPEFEPEYASLSSITPTSPSLPSPSLTLEFTDDVRELLSLPPTPLSASLARSEDSTSLSSPTKPPPPETLTSMPAHSLPSLRPSPGETCCNPVLEPFSTPASSYHPESSLSSQGEPIPFLLASPEASPNAPISLHPTLPQRPPGPKTVGSDSSPLEIAPVPANLAPSPSTFRVIFSASSDLSSASPPSSLVLGNLELEFFPTPSSAVEIVPQSSPELSESESSL
ncbi:hypothetical protein EDB84DRAFT_1547036, partial [Lactarius hengduanensis]